MKLPLMERLLPGTLYAEYKTSRCNCTFCAGVHPVTGRRIMYLFFFASYFSSCFSRLSVISHNPVMEHYMSRNGTLNYEAEFPWE